MFTRCGVLQKGVALLKILAIPLCNADRRCACLHQRAGNRRAGDRAQGLNLAKTQMSAKQSYRIPPNARGVIVACFFYPKSTHGVLVEYAEHSSGALSR